MHLSKEGYSIRPANVFERDFLELPQQNNIKKPQQPEKSKYFEPWCQVEDILVKGDDAIIEFNDFGYYKIRNMARGLKRLSKQLKRMGRIDYEIVTKSQYTYEITSDSDGTTNPRYRVNGGFLQVRAIFPEESP